MKLIIDNKDKVNIRIDVYIKDNSKYSRSYIEKMIDGGLVKVDGNVIDKSSYKTRINDIIEFEPLPQRTITAVPENIPLDILYEDNDILIINKARGMVVHPSNGHENGTLVNAVMYHCKDNLSTINGVIRPGIVHRIDKDTSGILCICKNDIAHTNISEQFAKHTNVRKYKAIVKGVIKNDEGIINKSIARDTKNRLRMAISKNGKNAITKYKVLKRYDKYTYIECELLTGRTHQIRVHMKYLGYPLLGDPIYGRKDSTFPNLDGQLLHAYYLKIKHPKDGRDMEFESNLPLYFVEVLARLDGKR